ncbi:MAG TPA: SRPBCC family protein [Nocardioidaceae bacterium]|nr:SRPBCC family protein [Nocardioidaceae bacterium]
MDLKHTFTVPATLDETWAAFEDIESVAGCFPGATVTSVDGDDFKGSCKVKLGPIALVYNGSGHFVEKDKGAGRFVLEAKGKDKRGNGTAGATVTATMSDAGSGSTAVEVLTDLSITGKPAQFGRGVIQDVSDKLLGQFVACLEKTVGASPVEPVETKTVAEAPTSTPTAPKEPATATDGPTADQNASTTATDRSAGGGATVDGSGSEATKEPSRLGAPSPARSSGAQTDALDLGATVLPVLAKAYWKQALGGLGALALLVWVWRRLRS